MGKFHDELVQARRDGVAPPQVEQLAAHEPPEPITYSASSIPGAWSCGSCYALVDGLLTEIHSAWHVDTGTT